METGCADFAFDLGSRSTTPIAADWHDGQIIRAFVRFRRAPGIPHAQRLELPFACPCFSLAWARKDTARAADIGIAGLLIVGIAVLVIDHDRFAACLARMMMFRCSGRLD
jgi:hypothetical protein